MAPDNGYEAVFSTRLSASPGKGYDATASDEQRYFFRVRTIAQDGNIVGGIYGKIKGGLGLDPMNAKTCMLHLAYYLNPTSLDRNMEFDQTQNLLANLKDDERPRDP